MKISFFQILYNISFYSFMATASPYFLLKVLTTPKYRSGLSERLGFLRTDVKKTLHGKKIIWVHAVSVGEAQTAFPLIVKLKNEYKGHHFLLTTTTATGQKLAQSWAQGDPDVTVMYFPLDFFHIFHLFLKKYSVSLIIVMETEIWPNFLMEAYCHTVPVILANGRISDKSYRGYRKLQKLFVDSVRPIKFFCMQEESDAEKLLKLGIAKNRIRVTGNIKYEVSLKNPVNYAISKTLLTRAGWSHDDPVLIAGSTHNGEEEIVCGSYLEVKKSIKNLKMIIAPRHPERIAIVERILSDSGIPYIKKTTLDNGIGRTRVPDVILLDTMGELRHLYAMATVAFVGKSLVPGGGQNILEPASLGKPVVFGPYMANFAHISKKIVDAQAGVMIHSPQALTENLLTLFSQPAMRESIGKNALAEVTRCQGTTDKIMECVKEIYPYPDFSFCKDTLK